MNAVITRLVKLYRFLLCLYPARFRAEFQEQMLLDFSDMATDANKNGIATLAAFCMRELFDFPLSLLQAHWKEHGMAKIFDSPPVAMGIRSALGFSLGFAGIALANWQISHWLFSTLDPWIQHWSVWYYDTFRRENGIFLFQDFLIFLTMALNGLTFGLMFAFLLGWRSNYLRYILVGMFASFISNSVSYVLSGGFGWSFYLSTSQSYVLGISMFILAGAFWGAICTLLDSSPRMLLRFLGTGAILYPLSTYLFIKFLFLFWVEITPWFFVTLIVFVVTVIETVFLVVARNRKKVPWMVIAGAIGYPILFYGVFYLAYEVIHLPSPGIGEPISPEEFIVYELNYMVVEASLGAIFGLLLGIIWGYQRKNDLLLLAPRH
jgi:hypothetical protein